VSNRYIRRHIGQLLISGFDGLQIPPEMRSLAREFDLGGIILFKRNVEAPEQVAEVAYSAQELADEQPLWVSVDQEGGRVARLREPFTRWPPMAVLGRAGNGHAEKLAARFAKALALELKAVGITLDFAPVLDILTNKKNPAIGDRSISDNVDVVTKLGRVMIETLQANGMAAAGKHFPGHGDVGVDSHDEMPICEAPPDRLRAVEMKPFRAAIDAKVAFILTAHLLFPAIDEEHPATLSRKIVYGMLREELGFEGAILTDDLDMGAIAKRYSIDEAVVRAINAGCDGVLICGGDYDKKAVALEGLIRAVEDETLPIKRVEDALARMQRAKERFLLTREPHRPDPRKIRQSIGLAEHQAIADEMFSFL
jgi:beta-N-acetylhexosaminidase